MDVADLHYKPCLGCICMISICWAFGIDCIPPAFKECNLPAAAASLAYHGCLMFSTELRSLMRGR